MYTDDPVDMTVNKGKQAILLQNKIQSLQSYWYETHPHWQRDELLHLLSYQIYLLGTRKRQK